jgi:hypothetical protein
MHPHYTRDRQRPYGGCGVQIYTRSPHGSVPRIEASDDLGRAPATHVLQVCLRQTLAYVITGPKATESNGKLPD